MTDFTTHPRSVENPQIPPPTVCTHPRERWVSSGTGSITTRADGTTSYAMHTDGWHCGGCHVWIPNLVERKR